MEVLAVERDSRALSTMKLEIVQDGKYSESVFEVIDKKLAKMYERGTVLVVVIEETEQFLVAELHDFIREKTSTACGFSSSAALENPAGSRGCRATRSRVTARTISSGWRRRSISGTGTPAS